MSYPDPNTRFSRKYSPLFDAKHVLVKLQNDRDTIRHHTIQIANHLSPNNIADLSFVVYTPCNGDTSLAEYKVFSPWERILYELNIK